MGQLLQGPPAGRRALVVEDQRTMRELLAELLEGSLGYEVRACGTASEARDYITRERFDLVVLDLVLPDEHGLELLPLLQGRFRSTRVVVLTAHSRPAVVREATERGAHGVVTKGAPLSELREAIERVSRGGIYYCSETSKLLREAVAQPERDEQLTQRQREILRAVARGMSTREIARDLGLSEKTVSNHRARIMERLGMHDVASLTRYAVTLGLVDPSP